MLGRGEWSCLRRLGRVRSRPVNGDLQGWLGLPWRSSDYLSRAMQVRFLGFDDLRDQGLFVPEVSDACSGCTILALEFPDLVFDGAALLGEQSPVALVEAVALVRPIA